MIRQRRKELVAHGNHKTECNGSLRYEVKQFTKVVLIQNVGVAVLTATPAYKSSQDPGIAKIGWTLSDNVMVLWRI